MNTPYFQSFFPRLSQNPSKHRNYQVSLPSGSHSSKQVYPPGYSESNKDNIPAGIERFNQSTSLKLVPVRNIEEVKNDISKVHSSTITTSLSTKNDEIRSDQISPIRNEENGTSVNNLHSIDKPIKSPSEFTNTIIPIISVVVVFGIIGAVTVFFRKKIYLSKPKDSKMDMVSHN